MWRAEGDHRGWKGRPVKAKRQSSFLSSPPSYAGEHALTKSLINLQYDPKSSATSHRAYNARRASQDVSRETKLHAKRDRVGA